VLTHQIIASPTLLAKEQELLTVLLEVRNPQQRLAMIVEHARRRAPLDAASRVEGYRVQGCLVRTWFIADMRDGKCAFKSDSDAVMLKALLGLLCDLYSGFSPEEIAGSAGEVLSRLGVLHQLAENRQRTVLRIAEQIHDFARAQLRLAA
jgi:cysteine desulfuration protein SufE